MRHAEAVNVELVVVVAVAVVLGVGAQLDHAERRCRSGEKINSTARAIAGADEGIYAGHRVLRRRHLRDQSARHADQPQQSG